MRTGEFIWADLSTYNTHKSLEFYDSLFKLKGIENEGYYILSKNESAIAGLYETPAFFQKIKMPHFWMSYFQAESVADISKIAEAKGGKVELNNIPFYDGNISLIRDPLGAGFTVYNGKNLKFSNEHSTESIVQTELHTSNIESALNFYHDIFRWEYKYIETDCYQVLLNNELTNIQLKSVSNEIKGKYEYWVVTFKANNLDQIKDNVSSVGGSIIQFENKRILVSDNSGETFFYIE